MSLDLGIASAAELDALFTGLAFYGTGGGGSAAAGLALLRASLGPDWLPRFVSPDSLPDAALACAAIVIGGRDPPDSPPVEALARFGLTGSELALPERFVLSVRTLERYLGQSIGALALVELGSMATAAALIAAEHLGIPVLDSDGTGRSIPELGLAKFDLLGLPVCPLALVDRFGSASVIAASASTAMADRLARFASRAAWGRGLACVGYPAPLHVMRGTLVASSIRKALGVGRVLTALQSPSERLCSLLTLTGGRLLFTGLAREPQWRSQEPYAFRELDYTIEGTGDDAGSLATVWIKNEHHLVRRNGEELARSPDPIAVLDAFTLAPLSTTGEVTAARAVIVVVVPALDPIWSTPAGLDLLSPERMA